MKHPNLMAAALSETRSFRLRPLERKSEAEPLRSQLLKDGAPTGVTLDGVVIEAQLALDDRQFLLLLADDCPYEEVLHVYLLNAELQILDQLELGRAYTSGIFRDLRVVDPRTIQFVFHMGAPYKLTVHQTPRYLWNPGSGLKDLMRLGSKRYLQITRVQNA